MKPAFLVGVIIAFTLLFMMVLFVPRAFATVGDTWTDSQGLEYIVTSEAPTYQAAVTASSGGTYAGSYTVPASLTNPNSGYNYAITGVDDMAFYGCDQVTSVTLPEGIKTIGMAAFMVSGITTANIPSTVTSIGDGAFVGNVAQTSFTVAAGNTTYSTNGSALVEGGTRLIAVAAGLTSVTVPNTVTTIGDTAFGLSSAPAIVLPEGVTTVEQWAFTQAQASSITFPTTITDIAANAFDSAPNLTDLNFAGAIPPMLDPNAFTGTTPNTITVHVPSNVTAYDGWAALYSVTIAHDLAPATVTMYSVVFVEADGVSTTVQVAKGGLVTQPADPTNGSLTFDGWCSNVDKTLKFDFATPIVQNTVLYARWLCTVTYDAAGGAPAPAPATVVLGGKITAPAAPALAGQVFSGWFNGATLFNFLSPVTGNITLTASWTPDTSAGQYAGAFLNGGNSDYPGYLSWGGATMMMAANGVPAELQGSAHGGYITTTTKCAVCHSVHRATGGVAVGSIDNRFLTAGDDACVLCHTTWGGGSADSKVEWASPGNPAGPHTDATQGFTSTCVDGCHTSGIHGSGTSVYHAMNAWLLGSEKDPAITVALNNGNVNPDSVSLTRASTTGADWFLNGTAPALANGALPGGMNSIQFAAAKSVATGYTCSKVGCHQNGQFSVSAWGYSDANQLDPAGNTVSYTGHATGGSLGQHALAEGSLLQPSCGPCHPGGLAGGYRTTEQTIDSASAQYAARSFGCDQCHDAVGVATNSTAWPHGNNGIKVYQWDKLGVRSSFDLAGGNLWMYASNVASVDSTIQQYSGKNDAASYYAAAQLGVDKSFLVLQGAVGDDAPGGIGTIEDGVCLKCHVPIDGASVQALGGTKFIGPAARPHLAYMDANGTFVPSAMTASPSDYIFLYK